MSSGSQPAFPSKTRHAPVPAARSREAAAAFGEAIDNDAIGGIGFRRS